MPFGKIITLIGVRRSGKASFLFTVMAKLVQGGLDARKVLYLNFEDERLDLKRTNST